MFDGVVLFVLAPSFVTLSGTVRARLSSPIDLDNAIIRQLFGQTYRDPGKAEEVERELAGKLQRDLSSDRSENRQRVAWSS